MAGVVYGAPYAPPAITGPLWDGMPLAWRGWDGSEWDFGGHDSGVRMLQGVRGLGSLEHTHWRDASPAVAGSMWRGAVADSREVFWPLVVFSDSGSADWVAYDRAFWRTLQPSRTGAWTVTHPDGAKRSLTLRFQEDTTPTFDVDPVKAGWAVYGIKLMADNPYWEGEVVTRSWRTASSVDFFNGSSKAPNFNISPGSTLATARLTNPGDVESHLTWKAYGPFTSVTVGVDGRTVVAPIAAAEGQVLEIDTDPSVQAAFLDGVDVTAQLTSADFATLPPGEDVTLSLAMAGTGWVEASFRPLYLRAW